MTPIIEGLKSLIRRRREKWYETGRRDGFDWASSKAMPEALDYAATQFKTQRERGKLVSYNPTKDEVIGLVFVGVFTKYGFSWKETERYMYVPGREYREWEQGFTDAVREYWEHAKE